MMRLNFSKGLGDAVHLAYVLELYRRHGYDSIVFSPQHKTVFELAGTPTTPDTMARDVPWSYDPDFNCPRGDDSSSGNHIAAQLQRWPLPDLGMTQAEAWSELASLRLTPRPPASARVSAWLRDLPRPILVYAPAGTSFAKAKNFPPEFVRDLTAKLADLGSVVVWDQHFRTPPVKGANIRHTANDWGQLDLMDLAALVCAADMFLGVDTGPFHLASALYCRPSIFLGSEHYFSCVCLPRPECTVYLTRDHPMNQYRTDWNVRLWDGTPDEALAQVQAMLCNLDLRRVPVQAEAEAIDGDPLEALRTTSRTQAEALRIKTYYDAGWKGAGLMVMPALLKTGWQIKDATRDEVLLMKTKTDMPRFYASATTTTQSYRPHRHERPRLHGGHYHRGRSWRGHVYRRAL